MDKHMPTTVPEIPLKNLHPSPLNPRKHFDDSVIKELSQSIKEKGVLEPLIVRQAKKGYEIICGECRFRAATKAALATVPCIVRKVDDSDVLEMMLTENNQRSNLTPIEEADAIRKLADMSEQSTKEIALKLGRSTSFVAQRLRLSALPEITKKAVLKDELPLSVAVNGIGRIEDKQGQIDCTKFLLSDQASHFGLQKAMEYIRDHYLLELAKAPFDVKDVTLPRAWDKGKPGPCTNCPFNTENVDELFAEMGKVGRCLKADCFHGKSDESWKRRQVEAKQKGISIIPDKTAKDLFYASGELNYDAVRQYVDLSQPIQLPDGSTKEVAKAVDGKIETSLARRPGGSVAVLADRSEVMKLLKKEGVIETTAPAKSDAEREGALKAKIAQKEWMLLVREIMGKSWNLSANDKLAIVVDFLKHHTEGQRAAFVKKVLVMPKEANAEKQVGDFDNETSVFLMLIANLEFLALGKATEALAAKLKIDRTEIRKRAQEELAPKEKKAKAKKKSESPKGPIVTQITQVGRKRGKPPEPTKPMCRKRK